VRLEGRKTGKNGRAGKSGKPGQGPETKSWTRGKLHLRKSTPDARNGVKLFAVKSGNVAGRK